MSILLFKALHIIGFVAWFAGMFYLVRLFIYQVEALERSNAEQEVLVPQFQLMARRLNRIIIHPAMGFTLICGTMMLVLQPEYLKMGWIHFKLLLVVLLVAYQIFCGRIMKALEKGIARYNSTQLRMINEIPTLLLIAIVLLAVFKNLTNFIYLFLALLALGISFYFIIKWYKRYRLKQERKGSKFN